MDVALVARSYISLQSSRSSMASRTGVPDVRCPLPSRFEEAEVFFCRDQSEGEPPRSILRALGSTSLREFDMKYYNQDTVRKDVVLHATS